MANLSQDSITKLFRDLCDADIQSTELERTSVCRFGVGVSHVLRTWNILAGGLRLQRQKSQVQMTQPLQTSSACHTNGARAVGTQMDLHVLSTSQEQSLDVLRFTRGCGGREHRLCSGTGTEQESIQHDHPRRHGLAFAVGEHCQS